MVARAYSISWMLTTTRRSIRIVRNLAGRDNKAPGDSGREGATRRRHEPSHAGIDRARCRVQYKCRGIVMASSGRVR